MPLVRVYNRNEHPLEDIFRGERFTILPNEFRLFEEDDSILYKGQIKPILLDGDGQKDPKGFKKLEIVPHEAVNKAAATLAVAQAKPLCHACGLEFPNLDCLTDHVEIRHVDQMIDEKAKEVIVAKKRGRPPRGGADIGEGKSA